MSNTQDNQVSLDTLQHGQAAIIGQLLGDKMSRQRFMALGIVRGQEISLETKAPLNDPRIYAIMGYRLSIRNDDAKKILISKL